ncbi:MAG: glycosyltransferase family 4 protein [Myxococcota bacterium]
MRGDRHRAALRRPHRGRGAVHRVRPSDAVLAMPSGPAGLPSRDQLDAYGAELADHVAGIGAFDVVHAHDLWLAPAARAIAARFDVPLVLTAHLLHAPHRAWWGAAIDPALAALERDALHGADAVIAVSRSMAEAVRTVHDVRPDRVHAVINGFDPAPFSAPAAPEGDRVVFAGRLDRQKGLTALIEAMARVVRVHPEAELVLAGVALDPASDDPYEADLSTELGNLLAHFAELGARTRFAGHLSRPALAALYATARVAVVPSVYEPCGYAAMEAMAAGLPVVATDAGGLAEVVVPGETGLLTPVDRRSEPHQVQVAPLADAILELLDHPERAAAMGAAGRDRAARAFGRRAMARATREVYAATLGARR